MAAQTNADRRKERVRELLRDTQHMDWCIAQRKSKGDCCCDAEDRAAAAISPILYMLSRATGRIDPNRSATDANVYEDSIRLLERWGQE